MYKIARLLQEMSPEVARGDRRGGEIIFPGGLVLPRGASFEASVSKCEHLWYKMVRRELGGGFVGIFESRPEDTLGCAVVPVTRFNIVTDIGSVDLMLV